VLEERWKLDQLHLFRSRLRASGPRKQPAQEIVRVCGESDAGSVLASSAPYDVPIFEKSAHASLPASFAAIRASAANSA
jgi:hypothetical protein